MLIIGTKEEIQTYREHPGINQSTLKNIQYGLADFLKRQQEEGPKASFEKGSAVDCILTAPEGSFQEEYYISSLEKKPSETIMEIIQIVFDRVSSFGGIGTLGSYPQIIEDAINTVGWQANWKMETRISKITDDPINQEYFEDLKNSIGKTVLSTTQIAEIDAVVESLKTNELTERYFDRKFLESSQELVMIYQKPIYFTYAGQSCKALPDMVLLVVDENNIIEEIMVIDLKTMFKNTIEFFDSVINYRYDIQSSWYLAAVISNLSELTNLGYVATTNTKILPFMFIVESTKTPGNPLIYQLDESLIKQGRVGTPDIYFENRLVKKGKRGINSLLKEYLYYQENGFTEDILLKGKNGIVTLDINGIVA